MNKLFFSIFLVSGFFCHGQTYHRRICTISSDKFNIIYSGIENPLSIIVQNISPENVTAIASFGRLTKGVEGYYTYYTDTGSTLKISLSSKLKNDNNVSVFTFKVQPPPDPLAKIGDRSGGRISFAELRNFKSITTDSFYNEKRHPIISFQLCVIRNNEFLFRDIKNTAEHFNEEVQNALSYIQPGDSIIFKDILVSRYDKTLTILNPLTFLATQ